MGEDEKGEAGQLLPAVLQVPQDGLHLLVGGVVVDHHLEAKALEGALDPPDVSLGAAAELETALGLWERNQLRFLFFFCLIVIYSYRITLVVEDDGQFHSLG